jgi:hypothetical protein
MGTEVSTARAIRLGQLLLNWVICSAKRALSGYFPGVRIRLMAYKNSPHEIIKISVPTVAIPLRAMGTQTEAKVRNRDAPSSAAASYSDRGTARKNGRKMSVAQGVSSAASDKITASWVLSKCTAWKTWNRGIIVAV